MYQFIRRNVALALFVSGLTAAALLPAAETNKQGEKAMLLESSAFAPQGEIPQRYTCKGDDVSPPLKWSGLPANTVSLALIVDDPDAPDPKAPKMTWVHWVVYNIPPSVTELPENAHKGDLPAGILQGVNDWNKTGYRGPCPPIGKHRYFHKLYALDMMLPDLGKPNKADLERAMSGHVLDSAELVGTFQR